MSKDEVMNHTSYYITRYPEGYIPPDDPEANISVAGGTLITGLTWNLTRAGTLTISGHGAMPDFGSAADQPWNSNNSRIRKVMIEDGVTGRHQSTVGQHKENRRYGIGSIKGEYTL